MDCAPAIRSSWRATRLQDYWSVALQMRAKYGDEMEFIHQEVFQNNKRDEGLRAPLQAFNLQSEPWLFVIDKSGKVTARLEGSFGVGAFEDAVKTGL